jgi:lysophospholipase L1-like esterase
MKINLKTDIYILAISSILFLGCGGGDMTSSSDTNQQSQNNKSQTQNQRYESQVQSQTPSKYKYNRISIAGSSVTWGNGLMGVGDYIGPVKKYLRESVATTIMPNQLNNSGVLINDPLSYKTQLFKYNAGSELSGTLDGDEISIVFAAQRGSEDVIVEMIVDNKSLGEKTIKSNPIKSDSITFNGDGNTKSFDLGRSHTFNHSVSGYGAGFIVEGWLDLMTVDDPLPFTIDFDKKGADWAVVRKVAGKEVHHFITFKDAPNGNFTVNYDYGVNIRPIMSSMDNIQLEIGSKLESAYGDKWMSLTNDLKPTEGLDFRQNSDKAVKTWKIPNDGQHTFKLKVKSGKLILNFITNHMYYFQNAGIGGSSAYSLARGTHKSSSTDQIREFNPDLFIFESSVNDVTSSVNSNNWLEQDIGFTDISTNKIKIQNATSSILPGDVVVMGEYNGDINNIAVGIVSNWNSTTKTITFTTNVITSTNKICDIKRINTWENDVKTVIEKVTSNINHNLQVGIATCGVPDLDHKRLMGFTEKGKMMAQANNWMFFDFFAKTLREDWSTGDNVHLNTRGYDLFSEAITDIIFP